MRTTWDRRGSRDLQPGCAMGVRADGGGTRVNVATRRRDGAADGGVAQPDRPLTQAAAQPGHVPTVRVAGANVLPRQALTANESALGIIGALATRRKPRFRLRATPS
jgi:hypothetical protein